MITNIQFLRAFAALSVVIFHTNFSFRNGVHTEFHAVAIFFVISGFIMTYISRNDPAGFFYNRCVRIVPLYALLTLVLFFWKLKAQFPYDIFGYLAGEEGRGAGLTLAALLKSLLFIPYENSAGLWRPINAVGWTLNLEMYFYVLFSVALVLSKRLAPAIVGGVVLAVDLSGSACAGDVCAFYAQPITIYFVLGIAAYYLWRASAPWLEKQSRALLIQIAAAFAVFFFGWHLLPELSESLGNWLVSLINYLLPFLVVAAALSLHTAETRLSWKPVLVLGEASYALYLVHIFIIGQLRSMGYSVDAQIISTGVVMILSSFAAIFLHYLVERPITRYFHSSRAGRGRA